MSNVIRKHKNRLVPTTVTINSDILDVIDQICYDSHLTKSELFRIALLHYLVHEKYISE